MSSKRRSVGGKVGFNPPSDLIGRRGEIAFEKAITDHRSPITDHRAFMQPLFRPAFLGDKWPAIDYHVELIGVRGKTPYFFAQVKSTAQVASLSATHLELTVTKARLTRLLEIPGPTYLVGVHEPTDRVFVLSIHRRPTEGLYRIPLDYELNSANLMTLHHEVSAFWQSVPSKPAVSSFV